MLIFVFIDSNCQFTQSLYCLYYFIAQGMNQNVFKTGVRPESALNSVSQPMRDMKYLSPKDPNQRRIFISGIKSAQRFFPQKIYQKVNSSQEITQMAKLFTRFVGTANNLYFDHNKAQQARSDLEQPGFSKKNDSLDNTYNKKKQGHFRKNNAYYEDIRIKGARDLSDKELRTSSKGRKYPIQKKGKTGHKLAYNFGSDTSYHYSLNQNQVYNHPNIRSSSVSTELLPENAASRQKSQEWKITAKENPQDKLLKRQSFHIAIAYKIHLKKVQNSSPQLADPVYPARKFLQRYNRRHRK